MNKSKSRQERNEAVGNAVKCNGRCSVPLEVPM